MNTHTHTHTDTHAHTHAHIHAHTHAHTNKMYAPVVCGAGERMPSVPRHDIPPVTIAVVVVLVVSSVPEMMEVLVVPTIVTRRWR
jgi:hypothetical protein